LDFPIPAHRAIEPEANQGDGTSLPEFASSFPLEALIGAASADHCLSVRQETILLVEDEAFVRKVTAEVLESAGYRVLPACAASEALEAKGNDLEFVDLLLTDVVMPGLSGHELAAEFRALHPQTRVLLMSGYTEQLALSATSRIDYLAKPFSTSALLRRVRQVLDAGPSTFEVRA
jgi:two-component system cell cycle sensor histidine kinase/response regulator CckA